MAISEHKNGHFEEIRGWLQILELGSNSTIFHLLFDTYDSPGAVFIWKWEKYRPYLLVCFFFKSTPGHCENGLYSYDVHIGFLKQIGRNEKYLTWHSEWHTLCTYH